MRLAADRRLRFLLVPLAFGVVALAPAVSWAFEAFLKISDCNGPETSKAFQGQIRLSGFSSRLKIPIAVDVGGGGATGRPQLAPIEVLKDLDRCSPQFFIDAVTGRNIQTAAITFVRTTVKGIEEAFFRIKLTDVMITALDTTSVAKTGQDDPRNIQDPATIELNTAALMGVQEVVSLMFRKIELKDLKTGTTVTFDVAANRLQ